MAFMVLEKVKFCVSSNRARSFEILGKGPMSYSGWFKIFPTEIVKEFFLHRKCKGKFYEENLNEKYFMKFLKLYCK